MTPSTPPAILAPVDHLVYATPDLDAGIQRIEALLGVRPLPGGSHPNWGTRNALVALGPRTYLEVIGPDPDAPLSGTASIFGIDRLPGPALVTWAARIPDLDARVFSAIRQGIDPGPVNAGQRQRPDGVILSWRLTDPFRMDADGLQPFLIDWGDSPHPAAAAPTGGRLLRLQGEHPDPERVMARLRALDVSMPVTKGPSARLRATIRTRRGRVELG